MSHSTRTSTQPSGHAPDRSDSPPPSPRQSAILRAERQLAMLDRMAELGMELAEALQRRAVAEALAQAGALERAPGDPAPPPPAEPAARPLTRDPAEAFVRVTRAVRLTLAMQMRLETTIQALREGKTAEAAAAAEASPHRRPAFNHHTEMDFGTRPERVRDLVWDVVNHQVTDLIEGQETLTRLHERLIESETYDEFLFRPLRDGVEAVCADLGLTPDWSRWTGDGWAPPTSRYQYELMWGPPDPLPDRPYRRRKLE